MAEGSRPRTVVGELSPTNPSPSSHARADGLRCRWTGWGRCLLSSTRESWARSPGQGRQPGGVLRPQGQWDRGTEAMGTGRTRRVTEFSGFTPRVGGVRGGAPHPRDAQCVLITKTSFSTVPPPPPAPGRGTGHLGGQGPCDILPRRPGGGVGREEGLGRVPEVTDKNQTRDLVRGARRRGSPGRQSPRGTMAGQAGPRSHPRAGAALPPGPPDPGPPGRPSDFTLGSSLLVNVSHQLIRKIVSGACLVARCVVPIRSRSLGPTVQLLLLLKFLVSVAGALLDLRDAYQPADSEGGCPDEAQERQDEQGRPAREDAQGEAEQR